MKNMGMEPGLDHVLVGHLEASLALIEPGTTPIVLLNPNTGTYDTVILDKEIVDMGDGQEPRAVYVLSRGRHGFTDLGHVVQSVDLALADDDEG